MPSSRIHPHRLIEEEDANADEVDAMDVVVIPNVPNTKEMTRCSAIGATRSDIE